MCGFFFNTAFDYENAKLLINKKLALPLCGNKYIAFDKLEIITRKNYKVLSKTIYFKKINRLKSSCKKKVKQDLKKIILKRKNFFKPHSINYKEKKPEFLLIKAESLREVIGHMML